MVPVLWDNRSVIRQILILNYSIIKLIPISVPQKENIFLRNEIRRSVQTVLYYIKAQLGPFHNWYEFHSNKQSRSLAQVKKQISFCAPLTGTQLMTRRFAL